MYAVYSVGFNPKPGADKGIPETAKHTRKWSGVKRNEVRVVRVQWTNGMNIWIGKPLLSFDELWKNILDCTFNNFAAVIKLFVQNGTVAWLNYNKVDLLLIQWIQIVRSQSP